MFRLHCSGWWDVQADPVDPEIQGQLVIKKLFQAYLESKSKMCIFSLTNTNQNPVVLSLCLVSLNAHPNAPNSSLNFHEFLLW